jgi:hypothetical protein
VHGYSLSKRTEGSDFVRGTFANAFRHVQNTPPRIRPDPLGATAPMGNVIQKHSHSQEQP